MSSYYSAEFKQKAVELVTTQRKSIAQVSLELGVCKRTLYYWLSKQGAGSRTLMQERTVMDLAQAIERLRAQNGSMRKEFIQLRAE